MGTTDTYPFVCVHITYWQFHSKCHITFILHIYDITVISGSGGEGGGVTGEKVAKPLTTVFSTLLSVTRLDHLRETSRRFPAVVVAKKTNWRFWWSWGISSRVCGNKTGCFEHNLCITWGVFVATKTWSFPEHSQMFFVSKYNPIISTALGQHKIEI